MKTASSAIGLSLAGTGARYGCPESCPVEVIGGPPGIGGGGDGDQLLMAGRFRSAVTAGAAGGCVARLAATRRSGRRRSGRASSDRSWGS